MASLYKSPSRLLGRNKAPWRVCTSRLLVLDKAPWRVCTSRLLAFSFKKSALARLYKSPFRFKKAPWRVVQVAFSPSRIIQGALASLYKSPSRLLVRIKAPWRVCTSRLLAILAETRPLGELNNSPSRCTWYFHPNRHGRKSRGDNPNPHFFRRGDNLYKIIPSSCRR